MRRIITSLLIIALSITIGVSVVYFKSSKKESVSERIIPTFVFESRLAGKPGLPESLAIKGDYLFVTDLSKPFIIHILKINPDGSLTPKFIFGKKGEGLGEFGDLVDGPVGLAIREDYLYVSDPGNQRIQVLKLNL
jgi:hypothetical protein